MPLPEPTLLDAIRRVLPELGLEARLRSHDWWECLLAGAEESWSGQGPSADEALWSAIRAAFPTEPARAALKRWAAGAGVGAAVSPAGDDSVAATGEHATAATGVARAVPGSEESASAEAASERAGAKGVEDECPAEAVASSTAAEGAAPPTAASATGAGGTGRGADDAPARADEIAGSTYAVAVSEPAAAAEEAGAATHDDTGAAAARNDDEAIPAHDPQAPASTRCDEDAEVALRQLIERIEGDSRWLACAAPARQRLVLLGWLAAARIWQDDRPDPRVAALVPDVVRRLRGLTEAWWPGSITAFHRHAWPGDCVRDLPGASPDELQSWEDVAHLASAALCRLEERDLLAGLDADGWADAAQLRPAPDAADDSLAALVREIERHGPLSQRQPRERPVPPVEELVRWARWARWLRGATDQDATWGAVIGRLRYWCQGPDAAALRQVLDPAYRPHAPWSQLIGRAESEIALRDLLARVPAPDAGEAQRLAWLRRALALTTWHHEAIAEAAAPLGPWILSLSAERLGDADRRIRRRLRKLQESLAPEGELPEPEPFEEAAPADEPERAPIAGAVLDATRGRHALFVSNRSDPELQERLAGDFAFGALEWAEATPRRIDAAVEKIAAGTFEMVLGATGFLGHKEDGRLARACKLAGIPYVRVHKGRPAAVALALQRELPGAVA